MGWATRATRSEADSEIQLRVGGPDRLPQLAFPQLNLLKLQGVLAADTSRALSQVTEGY
jgi:hypothetical protein